MLYSAIIGTVGVFLSGPSALLQLPPSMGLIATGLTLIGVANFLGFVPCIPEVIESVQAKHNVSKTNNHLNDKASAIFNFYYSLGGMLGPIIGGYLGTYFGYRETSDIVGIYCLIFALLFGIFNTKREDFFLNRSTPKPLNESLIKT